MEGVGRGAEEHRRAQKALGRMRKSLEECGRHSEASEAKQKCKAVKRVEALQKSAGRKARGADEAGRVRIRSDEKRKVCYTHKPRVRHDCKTRSQQPTRVWPEGRNRMASRVWSGASLM